MATKLFPLEYLRLCLFFVLAPLTHVIDTSQGPQIQNFKMVKPRPERCGFEKEKQTTFIERAKNNLIYLNKFLHFGLLANTNFIY